MHLLNPMWSQSVAKLMRFFNMFLRISDKKRKNTQKKTRNIKKPKPFPTFPTLRTSKSGFNLKLGPDCLLLKLCELLLSAFKLGGACHLSFPTVDALHTLMQTGKKTHVLLHQGWVSCMTLPDRHLAPADQLRSNLWTRTL